MDEKIWKIILLLIPAGADINIFIIIRVNLMHSGKEHRPSKRPIEIIGEGETYQLDIKNKVDGSKYKWSSTNTKVARFPVKDLLLQ